MWEVTSGVLAGRGLLFRSGRRRVSLALVPDDLIPPGEGHGQQADGDDGP